VLNPGAATVAAVKPLLAEAHQRAAQRQLKLAGRTTAAKDR
jgi:hypothetical protein